MIQYLIRTNKDERKTHILRLSNPKKSIGLIYTDFNLVPGNRNITAEDIVNTSSNKMIAQVHLYENDNVVSIRSRKKELSAYTPYRGYKENGIVIPTRKITKDILLSMPEYKSLEAMGITHAYFLGDGSTLSQVFCFERDGDISGIVQSRKVNDTSALRGLTLVLAQKIENQKFIFEFMKK